MNNEKTKTYSLSSRIAVAVWFVVLPVIGMLSSIEFVIQLIQQGLPINREQLVTLTFTAALTVLAVSIMDKESKND